MAGNNYLNNIRNTINKLNEFDENRIFRSSLGTQSIDELKEEFNNLKAKTFLLLNTAESEAVSSTTFLNINRVLDVIYGIFNNINNIDDRTFVIQRAKNLTDLKRGFDSFKEKWQPIGWMFETNTSNSTDEEFQKAQQINAELQKELANVRTLANSLEQQAEEYKTRYSNINVNVELETQIYVFKTQAEQNKKESVKWFYGIIGSAVVLFITLIVIYCTSGLAAGFFFDYTFYNKVCETCGEHVLWVDMLKHIFFKLLILSVEIYVLTFCVKNYNACMHNKTNNEHRHNSFSAALHFYNTTTGEKRDEILIKVADAIFTYQKSGYYGKDSEPANPSLIQSVVDKVAGKG